MSSRWAARLCLFLSAVFALFGTRVAYAGERAGVETLAVCIAPAQTHATPAAALRARDFDCATEQHRFGPGDYWARSAPLTAQQGRTGQPIHVRIDSLWQDALTLHAVYADGHVVTFRTTSGTIGRHMALGALFDFALPAREAPLARLLWHVEGASNARGILRGQRLASEAASVRANLVMAAIYAAFGGLAFALLAYNLAIWTALRHRFQLAYCAMVAALLVYALSSSGALAWAIPDIDNNIRIRINYATLGLAAGAALLFARTFFEPHIFAPWLRRTVAAAVIIVAGGGIAYWPMSYVALPLANALYPWTFVLGLGAAMPILWAAWRHGSRHLTVFAVAWAAPILFSLVRVLDAFHIVRGGFWVDNSTVLTLTVESLLSSLAIAFRIQMLSRERDEAIAGEALARRLADADPLTGLLNRRAFLDQAIGRRGPQALYVIDIDRFKSVNDTLGHDGGDDVLRLFARTLRLAAPASALVARIGGEEFAILADVTDAIDTDRLLARLRATRMPFDLSVTASIGSCTGPLNTDHDWKRLYHNADRALFEAKEAGRDRAREGVPVPLAA